MKVAISFIGTNRYLDYLPQYYENIEKYFLPNSEKTILAFTDGELNDTPDNLKVYHQEHLPWPYITLKRFEIINKAREEIKKNDWFVFIDADALPVATVTEEEFLDRCCNASTNEVPLFGVHHPCHYLKDATTLYKGLVLMKLMKSQRHILMYQNYHLYIGKVVFGVVKFLLL